MTSNQNVNEDNILLDILEYDIIPYDKIKNEDYLPAFEYAINKAKEEFNNMTFNNMTLNKESFNLHKFEKTTDLFEQLKIIYNNKRRINSLDEENLNTETINNLINDFESFIYTNTQLYELISSIKVFNSKEDEVVQKHHMRKFLENGMLISNEADKTRVKEIKQQLAKLISEYESNLVKDTDAFNYNIIDDSKLVEFPDTLKEIARNCSKEKGYETGYCFTLQFPSYRAIMTYCNDREIRKMFYMKYGSKCYKTEHCNINNMHKILELRKEKAKLLGFKSYNEYVLSNRMAKNENNINEFQNRIRDKVINKAKEEYKLLLDFANEYEITSKGDKAEKINQLENWDFSYYFEKLKKKLFNVDNEELRKYFPLKDVFNILFNLLEELYSITITPDPNIKLYHKDLFIFNIKQNNNIIGYLYFDLYPRKEKTIGGWVYSLKPKVINKLPIVGIIANGQRPPNCETINDLLTNTYLTPYEAETIFHECGHASHIFLSETSYKSITGINVLWDFVETPSQLMENFIYLQEILDKLKLPQNIKETILKSKNFFIATSTLRQINYSVVDLKIHGNEFNSDCDIEKFENEHMVNIIPRSNGLCVCVAFSHLFNATYDYSCGYYSYMWSEVIALDGFEEFKKEENRKEAAKRYKEWILSKGGSDDPEVLFEKFKGRKFNEEAFLKDKGLNI